MRAFAKKGYHACRVSDIAEEAGVAYGLVYHYFDSKDAVLESVFREMWGMMVGAINAIEQIEESPREQLRKSCAIVLRTWRDYPDVVRVLVREVARSGEQLQREVEEIAHAFAALQRIVERGQEQGDLPHRPLAAARRVDHLRRPRGDPHRLGARPPARARRTT